MHLRPELCRIFSVSGRRAIIAHHKKHRVRQALSQQMQRRYQEIDALVPCQTPHIQYDSAVPQAQLPAQCERLLIECRRLEGARADREPDDARTILQSALMRPQLSRAKRAIRHDKVRVARKLTTVHRSLQSVQISAGPPGLRWGYAMVPKDLLAREMAETLGERVPSRVLQNVRIGGWQGIAGPNAAADGPYPLIPPRKERSIAHTQLVARPLKRTSHVARVLPGCVAREYGVDQYRNARTALAHASPAPLGGSAASTERRLGRSISS